ncbi:hypothetical protein Glove_809878g2 [Diversispora epigaea]|nr:hypothetical protein Glove_809878g2 [Diversispora epigaea]
MCTGGSTRIVTIRLIRVSPEREVQLEEEEERASKKVPGKLASFKTLSRSFTRMYDALTIYIENLNMKNEKLIVTIDRKDR